MAYTSRQETFEADPLLLQTHGVDNQFLSGRIGNAGWKTGTKSGEKRW
jgi:hypothetical protein